MSEDHEILIAIAEKIYASYGTKAFNVSSLKGLKGDKVMPLKSLQIISGDMIANCYIDGWHEYHKKYTITNGTPRPRQG